MSSYRSSWTAKAQLAAPQLAILSSAFISPHLYHNNDIFQIFLEISCFQADFIRFKRFSWNFYFFDEL